MNEKEIMSMRPAKAPEAMCRVEEFGAMLVVGDMPILNLNEDARHIWELCDGFRTVSEIENILKNEYEDDNLRERMLEFFNFCIENKLLVQTNS
jgi:hypothetical protein